MIVFIKIKLVQPMDAKLCPLFKSKKKARILMFGLMELEKLQFSQSSILMIKNQ